jgi:uncharacterized YigZ family protein
MPDLQPFDTVAALCESEFTEKKSRFIGLLAPAATEAEALSLLALAREKYPGATHYVTAWTLREQNVLRFNDDGEPGGTAGRPALEVLVREGLHDAAFVSVRYFGGILLGAGGLVRAYSRSACDAADAAGLLSMEPCTTFSLRVPYPYRNAVWGVFDRFGVLEHADYAESIDCTFRCRTSLADAFLKALTERTEARVSAAPCGEGYYGFPVAEGEENG